MYLFIKQGKIIGISKRYIKNNDKTVICIKPHRYCIIGGYCLILQGKVDTALNMSKNMLKVLNRYDGENWLPF